MVLYSNRYASVSQAVTHNLDPTYYLQAWIFLHWYLETVRKSPEVTWQISRTGARWEKRLEIRVLLVKQCFSSCATWHWNMKIYKTITPRLPFFSSGRQKNRYRSQEPPKGILGATRASEDKRCSSSTPTKESYSMGNRISQSSRCSFSR